MYNKLVPSAKERKGIRTESLDPSLIQELETGRAQHPNDFAQLVQNEGIMPSRDRILQEVDESLPEGTQLNLFANSDPQAFADYLDSDAVTGMNVDDLQNLDLQFSNANLDNVSEIANGLPEMLTAMNAANTAGPSALNNLAPILQAGGKLARLYAMLTH